VSGNVVLCKDLDALVVAEGIETAEELEAVRDAGAQYGQGYVLARPSFPPPSAVWPLAPKRNTKPPVARRTGGFGNKKKTS
jgi:EAL domain-containing protein (putative c-di-GMP-specific phosphodiesterase class I)